jgi:L-alanine-DL-glutamate epimerase-like enolase superfamily enzyme
VRRPAGRRAEAKSVTTPNASIQESILNWTPWIEELFDGKAAVIRAVSADLPPRPGLGVSLIEKMAAQHPYKPTKGPEYHFGDGSLTDQ